MCTCSCLYAYWLSRYIISIWNLSKFSFHFLILHMSDFEQMCVSVITKIKWYNFYIIRTCHFLYVFVRYWMWVSILAICLFVCIYDLYFIIIRADHHPLSYLHCLYVYVSVFICMSMWEPVCMSVYFVIIRTLCHPLVISLCIALHPYGLNLTFSAEFALKELCLLTRQRKELLAYCSLVLTLLLLLISK